MEVIEQNLPGSNLFVKDYMDGKKESRSFFDYGVSQDDMVARLHELKEKRSKYSLKELSKHLYTYNKSFLYNNKALEELEKLKDPSAVMIVGGQQAGLLTGPLYTISKAITVLKEAKLQESLLQVPVVPVFWIAGEDHDWDEINHVYIPDISKNQSVSKHTYEGIWKPGVPISNQLLDKPALHKWWEKLMKDLPETEFTAELNSTIFHFSKRSSTVTEFFGEVMRWLFRETGLILLDAHHPEIRTMERNLFSKMLRNHHDIQKAIKCGKDGRERSSYELPRDLPHEDSIHLFYQLDAERQLLYDYDEEFVTDKKRKQLFHLEDLQTAAEMYPQRFSSNVFTRPLIQEELLPVLCFVGGPGEINYWSLLKPLFHKFGNKVPPILPRIEYTCIPRSIQSMIKKEDVSLSDWLLGQSEQKLDEWLQRTKEVDGQLLGEALLEELEPYHQNMRKAWESVAPSEKSYGATNWEILKREIQQFANKIDSTQEKREQTRINRWKQTMMFLRPDNKPQERVFNVIWFVNKYGFDFVQRLYEQDVERNFAHKVINL